MVDFEDLFLVHVLLLDFGGLVSGGGNGMDWSGGKD
jgi:hypothetical protein